MYLSKLKIQNFRILKSVDIPFRKGLNVLLGENDSGKSAVVDAIRLILGTRDFERVQITTEDFYVDQNGRVNQLNIEAVFEDLSEDEAPLFLEWVGIHGIKPDGSLNYFLCIRLEATRKETGQILNKYDREVGWAVTAGPDPVGTGLAQDARDLLRATYLRPLRDAEQELAARKGSRLSQILFAHPEIRSQDQKEPDPDSLPGIMKDANKKIQGHPVITQQVKSLNEDYLANFSLGTNAIQAAISISDPKLRTILEHLELSLTDIVPNVETKHGLGLNNLLFMATELLLLRSVKSPAFPLLIIEEPEAHLHPQFQIRLMSFLEQQTISSQERQVQVIMTSHSPNLASKASLENVILIQKGAAYHLGSEYTKLEKRDYRFLQTFLDVTKANLFFARGVLIVEGDAERILLPLIAKLIDKPLDKYGISIVNVGHVGLFRYARIFQRKDDTLMGIKVACITDLDIPPAEAKGYLKGSRKAIDELMIEEIAHIKEKKNGRASGGSVKTYISPCWTLEYDLCQHSPEIALLVYQAIRLGTEAETAVDRLTPQKEEEIKTGAHQEFIGWQKEGRSPAEISSLIYESLYKKQASKVETAHYLSILLEEIFGENDPEINKALFPEYLIKSIDYITEENK